MKQKFREMQTNMQDQMGGQQDFTQKSSAAEKPMPKKSKEDYIDFEEIR